MANRKPGDEGEQPIDRTAFPIAVDGKNARDGTAARHHGKALAFGDVAEKLREMLIGLAGTNRSIHFSNLVDNTKNCNSGSLSAPTPGISLPKIAHSRSEEHTSELQSLMRISYAVFCLKKKNKYI